MRSKVACRARQPCCSCPASSLDPLRQPRSQAQLQGARRRDAQRRRLGLDAAVLERHCQHVVIRFPPGCVHVCTSNQGVPNAHTSPAQHSSPPSPGSCTLGCRSARSRGGPGRCTQRCRASAARTAGRAVGMASRAGWAGMREGGWRAWGMAQPSDRLPAQQQSAAGGARQWQQAGDSWPARRVGWGSLKRMLTLFPTLPLSALPSTPASPRSSHASHLCHLAAV